MEEKPRNDFFPNGRRSGGLWAKPGGLQGAHKPPLRHQGGDGGGHACGLPGRPLTWILGLYIPKNSAKKQGSLENTFPPPQASVSARSHLETLPGALPKGTLELEGFYINIITSPMTRE